MFFKSRFQAFIDLLEYDAETKDIHSKCVALLLASIIGKYSLLGKNAEKVHLTSAQLGSLVSGQNQ